ncbi:hypothetical protein B296_00009936 [Ensete ventricosum]|uniref:Uncharacterized protein n=1 Tax=Ensete ventricosum TaxID=4639 RepID=A0A427AHF0_ENSVE|nr:hypothetical protein B296_00009936 [Ensete ventricosum]
MHYQRLAGDSGREAREAEERAAGAMGGWATVGAGRREKGWKDAIVTMVEEEREMTTQRKLAKSSPKVDRGSYDVVGSSPRTHQKFVGRFVGSSPTGYRELAGSSPEECWKFIGSSLKEIESSPRVHRKDAGNSPRDNQTTKTVCIDGNDPDHHSSHPLACPTNSSTTSFVVGTGPATGTFDTLDAPSSISSESLAPRTTHPRGASAE